MSTPLGRVGIAKKTVPHVRQSGVKMQLVFPFYPLKTGGVFDSVGGL
jgi:hypothetical protein